MVPNLAVPSVLQSPCSVRRQGCDRSRIAPGRRANGRGAWRRAPSMEAVIQFKLVSAGMHPPAGGSYVATATANPNTRTAGYRLPR